MDKDEELQLCIQRFVSDTQSMINQFGEMFIQEVRRFADVCMEFSLAYRGLQEDREFLSVENRSLKDELDARCNEMEILNKELHETRDENEDLIRQLENYCSVVGGGGGPGTTGSSTELHPGYGARHYAVVNSMPAFPRRYSAASSTGGGTGCRSNGGGGGGGATSPGAYSNRASFSGGADSDVDRRESLSYDAIGKSERDLGEEEIGNSENRPTESSLSNPEQTSSSSKKSSSKSRNLRNRNCINRVLTPLTSTTQLLTPPIGFKSSGATLDSSSNQSMDRKSLSKDDIAMYAHRLDCLTRNTLAVALNPVNGIQPKLPPQTQQDNQAKSLDSCSSLSELLSTPLISGQIASISSSAGTFYDCVDSSLDRLLSSSISDEVTGGSEDVDGDNEVENPNNSQQQSDRVEAQQNTDCLGEIILDAIESINKMSEELMMDPQQHPLIDSHQALPQVRIDSGNQLELSSSLSNGSQSTIQDDIETTTGSMDLVPQCWSPTKPHPKSNNNNKKKKFISKTPSPNFFTYNQHVSAYRGSSPPSSRSPPLPTSSSSSSSIPNQSTSPTTNNSAISRRPLSAIDQLPPLPSSSLITPTKPPSTESNPTKDSTNSLEGVSSSTNSKRSKRLITLKKTSKKQHNAKSSSHHQNHQSLDHCISEQPQYGDDSNLIISGTVDNLSQMAPPASLGSNQLSASASATVSSEQLSNTKWYVNNWNQHLTTLQSVDESCMQPTGLPHMSLLVPAAPPPLLLMSPQPPPPRIELSRYLLVEVCHFENPANFYLIVNDEKVGCNAFETFLESLQNFYKSLEYLDDYSSKDLNSEEEFEEFKQFYSTAPTLEQIVLDSYWACFVDDELDWRRVRIIGPVEAEPIELSLLDSTNKGPSNLAATTSASCYFVPVRDIDSGFGTKVPIQMLRPLSEEYCSVPEFAIKSQLALIQPQLGPNNNSTWSNEALQFFQTLTYDKVLTASIIGVEIDEQQSPQHQSEEDQPGQRLPRPKAQVLIWCSADKRDSTIDGAEDEEEEEEEEICINRRLVELELASICPNSVRKCSADGATTDAQLWFQQQLSNGFFVETELNIEDQELQLNSSSTILTITAPTTTSSSISFQKGDCILAQSSNHHHHHHDSTIVSSSILPNECPILQNNNNKDNKDLNQSNHILASK